MNEIHSIMGEKHTTQILCVLDALGADWMKVEDFYMSELERGAKNIFTGQPLTAEQAADELWAALHRMAERLWLRSITREQAEAMESTAGQTIFWSGLRRLAFEWDMEYEDLLEQVHEASEAEIAEYGVYNSEE